MKLLKYLNLTIFAMLLSWGVWAVGPVTGTMRVCAGSTVLLYDTTLGGVWSSGNVAIATVDSSSGLVTGVSAGTVNITYTQGGTSVYSVFTVNALPFSYPFVGGGPYCDRTAPPHVATYGGSASGIAYQLYYNGAATGSPIYGSGGDVDFGSQSAAGMYFMVATNPVTGCATAHSDTAFVSLLAAPAPMVAPSVMCTAATATATDTSSGGVWISSNPSVIMINSAGVLNAATSGSAVITYSLTATGCAVAHNVTVNLTPAALTGATAICPGAFTHVTSSTYGGVYASSATSVATVNSFGYVYSVAPGVTTISYTLSSGCSASLLVTVNVAPAPISGPSAFCSGGTTVYSTIPTGGVWASSSPSVLGIGSASGIASGIVAGAATLSYTYSGCSVSRPVTVNVTPSAISGTTTGCSGNVIALSSTSGGVWNSSNTAVATVSSTGLVSCVSPGSALINYVLPSSCAVNTTVTVSAPPVAYNVSGGGYYCASGSGVHVGLLASDAGIYYQLYNGTTAVGSFMPGTGSIIDFGSEIASGTYTVVATNPMLGSCSTVMSGNAVVVINPLPSVYAVSTATGGGYCVGAPGDHILLSGSDVGTNYQLYNGSSLAGSPIAGTGASLDFGPEAAGTYTVLATNALTACVGAMASSATTFTVAAPTVYNVTGGGGYCTGGLGTHIGLSGSDTGVGYQLYHSGVAIGAAVSGSGSSIDFGLNALTGSYSVVAGNSHYGCSSAMSGAATVVTLSLPIVYNVTGGGAFCPGGGSHIILSNSTYGYSYQLYHNGAMTGSTMPGTGTNINFGSETLAGTYFVVANNIATHCADTMYGKPVIVIQPQPVQYTVTGGGSYCALGVGVHIGISGSETGVTYNLYQPGSGMGSGVTGMGGALDFGAYVSAGTYFVTARNTTTGCADTMTGSANVVVNPLPIAYTITGGGTYCPGGSGVPVGLSGSESGVNYQLYNDGSAVGVATPGTGGIIGFGILSSSGSYTVLATKAGTGCSGNMASSVSVNISSLAVAYPVAGGGSYCAGGSGVHVTLSGSTPGFTYRLYNGSSIMETMIGTGASLDFGSETMAGSYTVTATNLAACTNSMSGDAVVSITPTIIPSVAISVNTGDTVCEGTAVTYKAHSVNGGTAPVYAWYVNGVAAGTDSSYTYVTNEHDLVSVVVNSSATCVSPASASASFEVSVVPYPVISGASSVCLGSSATLSSESGGSWSSGNPTVAAVAIIGGTPGVVIGRSAGATTITYTVGPGCSSYMPVTVNPLPTVNATPSAENCGGSRTLTGTGADSYSWSPANGLSCTGCAAPEANPNATTIYTVRGTDALGCSSTATINFDADRIFGYVSYSGGTMSDSIKVWLISFNASDSSLTGLDSTYTCAATGGHYFEFPDKAAGNYMVKAKLLGQTPGSSGYIPTYGLSSAYWYGAASITHNGGDDQMNVHLLYGTVPSGPGFIGGMVSTGANRGTLAPAPARGVAIYLEDAFTHQVLTYVYTDSNGNYSFSRIAPGTYIIYPEQYGYTTTPSQAVYVTAAADSAKGIDFEEHTLSKTITPVGIYASGVQHLAGGDNITIYPNPASDVLNISWSNLEQGEATILIADVTGREVSRNTITVSRGSGIEQVTLAGLADGVYLVTIQAPSATRTGKLVIRH
jgi:Secretion system C-terminal sorting domain